VRAKAARGAAIGAGIPLYGHVFTPERDGYLLDMDHPDRAVTVRRIYALLDAGAAMHNTLVAEGVASPSGGRLWYSKTVGQLVTNPVYCGKPHAFRWKATKVATTNKRTGRTTTYVRDMPQAGVPLAKCEAVAPEDVWQRVKERLAGSSKRRATRKHPLGLLAGGFARCGVCGRWKRTTVAMAITAIAVTSPTTNTPPASQQTPVTARFCEF
jgi:hypothetical protein